MRKLPALIALLLFATAAQAQHSVGIAWIASPTAGIGGYNVYRAPCTGTITGSTCSQEGTFAKIGSATGLSYSDTTVTGGGLYVYYITSFCPTSGCTGGQSGESAGSTPHVATVVPKDPPLPPTGVTITTVARANTGANTTLSASWTAAPNTSTHWSFTTNGAIITQGTQNSSSGAYAVSWSGKLKPGSPVIFQVCDPSQSCDSRTV